MSVPIAASLQSIYKDQVRSEYLHPVLSQHKTGPGRRPEVDFALTQNYPHVSCVVESKWIGSNGMTAADILWDLLRLARPATALSDSYTARLLTFERARRKFERLLIKGEVTRHDVSLFYEGILLRTVTGLEGLMEELFVGLLAGSIIPGRNVHPRVTFNSHVVARDVMLGGRAFR